MLVEAKSLLICLMWSSDDVSTDFEGDSNDAVDGLLMGEFRYWQLAPVPGLRSYEASREMNCSDAQQRRTCFRVKVAFAAIWDSIHTRFSI
jgi:hypothetical protein